MRSFSTFVDSKERKNKENLHLLEQMLQRAGFQVSNYLDDKKEAYIFVHKPTDVDPIIENLTFEGIRLYTRGNDLVCYRAQNKKETEPYGNTYLLDVKGMFKDLVKEHDKDKVGHRIIFNIIKELKDFFVSSAEAEKQEDKPDSKMGSVVLGSVGGTDYANTIGNDMSSKR